MSRKTRMADLQQAKDRRMKKIAAGGVVLLAVVLAFEVPKLLNRGGGSSAPPAATTTDTSATSAPASTAPGTAAAAVLPTSGTRLPSSDQTPKRSKAQLFSFSRFAGKDPFVQKVSDPTQGQPDAQNTAAVSRPGSTGKGSSRSGGGAAQASSARTLAASGAVKIQINGKIETVRVGGSFPSSNPLFRLVSVTHGVAKIGIAHGSLSSGAGTVAMTPGRSLTLVDTANGVRYRIRLLSAS